MRMIALGLIAAALLGIVAGAQGRKARDFPCVEVRFDGDANRRYVRMGPKKKRKPRRGFGLLIMIPGDIYDPDVACWNTYRHSCGTDYVAVQLIPPRRKDGRRVWPTRSAPSKGTNFLTEAFVEEVVDDVCRWTKIDRRRIFVFAWDSGGPAAYEISLQDKKSPTGYFIAMSMFRSKKSEGAKGQAYYIYHSRDDTTCPFDQALKAAEWLRENGATVELILFPGGHIWSDAFYGRFAKAIRWLERNHAKPSKSKKKA